MKNNYNDILKIIQETPPLNNYNLKYLQKIITVDDIKDLDDCIKNRKTLISFREKHTISSNACTIFFNMVLPLLFDEKEIDCYLLDLLLLKYNDFNNWTKPTKKESFFNITGYVFDGSFKRNLYIGIRFSQVYDNIFIKNHFYPEIFKQDTINLINNNEPLVNNYKIFKEKFAIGSDSYLVYLDFYIIDIIGEDVFKKYIETMLNKYIESLPFINLSNLTNDKILNYIFGYNWSINMHIHNHESSRKGVPSHYRLHILLLELLFPITIGNYRGKKNRNTIYKTLNFSEEKIVEYENIFDSINHHESLTIIGATDNLDELELPSKNHISYIYKLVDKYFDNIISNSRIIDSKNKIFYNIRKNTKNDIIKKDLNYIYKIATYRNTLLLYIENKIVYTKNYFYEHNVDELKNKKDIYIIYSKKNKDYKKYTFNISIIMSNTLKEEIIMYLKSLVHNKSKDFRIVNKIINIISFMESEFEIEKIQDIQEWHILSYLQYIEVSDKLKPTTLDSILRVIKSFILFFINTNYIYKPIKDPTLNIKLNNTLEHIKHTPVIPDDILIFLDKHINELKQKDCILIYKILIETGWRFGDIREILIKDIKKIPNNNELASISVSSPKTKTARIKRGLGDKLEDVISIELYNEIQEYIDETQPIRNIYDIKTLFFSIKNNTVSHLSSQNFNNALNTLLKKHGIQSINSDYLRISSRHTRKTVASTLITSGVPSSAVQKKLGHVTSQTTERYYAEVQQKRIGELNTEFYKQKFDIYIDNEKLKLFTEEERKLLYIDFCLNKRNVELGVCSKHPSEGRCITLGYTSCSQCPKLCTGIKYLEQWEKLANDSKILLEQFITTYKKHNIPETEYKEFLEFKQEYTLYKQYVSVIDAIKKEAL